MKITRLEARLIEMELEEPYSVAYESYDKAVNVLLRLETDQGINGFGCAAPDDYVTGETPQKVLEAIDVTARTILLNQDPRRPVRLMENLKPHLATCPSALTAIDMALYDIMAKKAGLPLWKMLGGFRESIKTSMTIGILPEDETVRQSVHWIKKGFTCLKIKGGNNVDEDIARILKVREKVGGNIDLRFDANQGYTVEESINFAASTKSAGLEFIEQPTPQKSPEMMGQIMQRTEVPIMADESLVSLEDAVHIVRNNLADMLNIKLMKVGGIYEALRIASLAGSAGMKMMIGCMDESALSISAGLALTLACPDIEYADLDGHIGLKGDPAKNLLNLENGVLHPSTAPGLGLKDLQFS
jgi:L-Ala-D/L-Glu epimerase / N-acetyl-D-glutamate racemase